MTRSKLFFLGMAACLMWLLPTDSASGQLVRVFNGGGVQIRAPFVRVNVGPYGGTNVRAPFVRHYSPGYAPGYYPGPYRGNYPVYPSGTPYPNNSYPNNMVQPGTPAPSYPPSTQPVYPPRSNVPRNNGVVPTQPPAEPRPSNPPDVDSSRGAIPGSKDLRSVLETNVDSEPLEQQRLQLAQSAKALDGSFAKFANAKSWQEYLQLPAAVFQDSRSGDVSQSLTDTDFERLRKVLQRYDSTVGDATFQKVTGLPHFQTTYRHLKTFVQQLESQNVAHEEIPPPQAKPNR